MPLHLTSVHTRRCNSAASRSRHSSVSRTHSSPPPPLGGGGHTLYQYQHNSGSRPGSQQAAAAANGAPPELNGRSCANARKQATAASTPALFRLDSTCECHDRDYPPWTGEIHGMSQALLSKSLPLRIFWWLVLVLCTSCGTATTILVIIEYIRGPTATSTTIRLVPSLELPAISVCPKVPDAFNFEALYRDMREKVEPSLTQETARDLLSFWIGGSGLENMDTLPDFNDTYLEQLGIMYDRWRQGDDVRTHFEKVHAKYGYKCADLFHNCELGGKPHNCCETIFQRRPVMRRGLCYQTQRNINQTEADDIGRLVLEIKSPASVTSARHNYFQPQIIIYVNDNFEQVLDFPRFYLYPHEWNRMHFTARLIELLDTHTSDCTNKLVGKDASCFVRNWLSANVIDPYNCTVPYLDRVTGVPIAELAICEPHILAKEYQNAIQLVHSGSVHSQECIPGCTRWEYSVSLQQSPSLQPFVGHEFNLEVSFYDLQYEHVKEVFTTSVPGFMSQIGGQFGFFLGLSIITVIQIAIYGLSASLSFCVRTACNTFNHVFSFVESVADPPENVAIGGGAHRQQTTTTILASVDGGIDNQAFGETSFIEGTAQQKTPTAGARWSQESTDEVDPNDEERAGERPRLTKQRRTTFDDANNY